MAHRGMDVTVVPAWHNTIAVHLLVIDCLWFGARLALGKAHQRRAPALALVTKESNISKPTEIPMKFSILLRASLLLSAFATGCAVSANTAPNGDEVKTDESADALRRAQVKGHYVRSAVSQGCGLVSQLELRANGTFVALPNYYGPNVLCAEVIEAPITGRYSVGSNNLVTFRVGGRGAFTLRFAKGALSDIRGSKNDILKFSGSFRKLDAGECLDDSGCRSNEVCTPLSYIQSGGGSSDPSAPVTTLPASAPEHGQKKVVPVGDNGGGSSASGNAGSGGGSSSPDSPPEFTFPAVPTGICTTNLPELVIDPVCPLVYSPVCATNGMTYGNSCALDAANATLAHAGECGPIDANIVCAEIYSPVCGSNGITYGNECEAGRIPGIRIAHSGKCLEAPRLL